MQFSTVTHFLDFYKYFIVFFIDKVLKKGQIALRDGIFEKVKKPATERHLRKSRFLKMLKICIDNVTCFFISR